MLSPPSLCVCFVYLYDYELEIIYVRLSEAKENIIAMAFAVWGRKLLGKKVILHTDNQAFAIILNTKTSKSKLVMHLLRPLIFL